MSVSQTIVIFSKLIYLFDVTLSWIFFLSNISAVFLCIYIEALDIFSNIIQKQNKLLLTVYLSDNMMKKHNLFYASWH